MRQTKIKQGISPENKAKMVANLPRKPHSKEWNEKISKGNLGNIMSEESKLKMTKNKIINNITGEIFTPNQARSFTNYSRSHFNSMMLGIKTNKTIFSLFSTK